MHSDIERVLIKEEQIKKRVKEMADEISSDYKGKDVLLIAILKGGVIFAVDLMREMSAPVEIDFMAVSSYANSSKSSGVVKIIKDLDVDIEGRNILIIEDIVDSGRTLSYLKDLFVTRNPGNIKICTLLNKPSRRAIEINVDYTGFDIPDEYVVGYGLDYAERHRNLPYMGVLKRSVYEGSEN